MGEFLDSLKSFGLAENHPLILKGVNYLLATQNPDGSWAATTRPPGGNSYAQRVSTTGWATLALAGVIYHLHPAAAQTRLARLHFWIHNLSLPVFMISLSYYLLGHAALMGVVVAAALLLLVGLGLFMLNILSNVRHSL